MSSCRDDKDDRFQLYLDKTFNKTASLMANACKAVALLANEGNAETNITVRAVGEIHCRVSCNSLDVGLVEKRFGQNCGQNARTRTDRSIKIYNLWKLI